MAYTTPGVFVEEIASFPPSVVAADTAIPAFIGYTEMAEDENGESLLFEPRKIKSLLDYEALFGRHFIPDTYEVELDETAGYQVSSVTIGSRYFMYDTMRSYFLNGGGSCYIVSVGSYTDTPALGDNTTPAGFHGGLDRLRRFDEPTIILFPDGVSLSGADLNTLRDLALAQCADLQDRFTVMDLINGDQPASLVLDPIEDFRNTVGTSNLKYGAAYYPWIKTIFSPSVTVDQLDISDSTGGIAITEITVDATQDALLTQANDTSILAASVSGPMASILAGSVENFQLPLLLTYASDIQQALENLDSGGVTATRPLFEPMAEIVRQAILSLEDIRTNAAMPSAVQLQINAALADADVTSAIVAHVGMEYEASFQNLIAAPADRDDATVTSEYGALNETDWIGGVEVPGGFDIALDNPPVGTVLEQAVVRGNTLLATLNTLFPHLLAIFDVLSFDADEAVAALFEQHVVFKSIKDRIESTMSTIPVSGAIAGVYASVDRTRGVWKAPANVSLSGVIGPAVKINDQAQGGLNVDTSGKSINAIRAFAGKGSLVWGARTLDGNSNEWRYIPVRRFFNMAEESIKKATEPFTFENNDANTWIRVRAMIENFLTLQWRAGALAGEKTAHAFYVKVGLGETMTAQDILEGRMIVEMGLAVVRPAEFIILKFSHKMQES